MLAPSGISRNTVLKYSVAKAQPQPCIVPVKYLVTVCVLNFVGKIFMFLVGKKLCEVLIFVAMEAW